ncbi:MAG TPA: peptide-methionine (S)-S-oxide reductase MsrA [Bacteriovoracaceae bacterium]|nr:peptide-methionine (S)-S-oxide reductase MsrA [Bacteriovoracaceae bacterium]
MKQQSLFLIMFFCLLGIPLAQAKEEKAIFAGGCFWCMEPPFEKLAGVLKVASGYSGGHKIGPSYKEVSKGGTGHVEVVEITFDPDKVSYKSLLATFWKNVDPLDSKGQFCDKGDQYLSGIYTLNDEQKAVAEKSLHELKALAQFKNKSVATFIKSAGPFYPAEEYHQDYYKKNPLRYKFYRASCARDKRLNALWENE